MNNTEERIRDLLLTDGVKPGSISPYIAAWNWAESGRNSAGLSANTVQTYEADARRVYRLLSASTAQ